MKCPVVRGGVAILWVLVLLGLGSCVDLNHAPDVPSTSVHESGLASGWTSPLDPHAHKTYWYPVTCGSSAHVDGAFHAADIPATSGAKVYAAHGGVIQFAGLAQDGHYGYLVVIHPQDSTGHSHYYGHLGEIDGAVLNHIGAHVDRGERIGTVGEDPLHFHVETDQGVSVSLVGMTGFADKPNDPYYPSNDGVLHHRCAWMSGAYEAGAGEAGAGCMGCCKTLDPTVPGACP